MPMGCLRYSFDAVEAGGRPPLLPPIDDCGPRLPEAPPLPPLSIWNSCDHFCRSLSNGLGMRTMLVVGGGAEGVEVCRGLLGKAVGCMGLR